MGPWLELTNGRTHEGKGQVVEDVNLVADELKAKLGKGVDVAAGDAVVVETYTSEGRLVTNLCRSLLEALRKLSTGRQRASEVKL